MATITKTTIQGNSEVAVSITTLGASDTFDYLTGKGATLILNNVTVGALTVNIDGDGGTTVPVRGVGEIDITGGFSTASIGAGLVVAIPLDGIFQYLQGVIAVTGGDGIEASILEY
jgi:hypothetical protein